MAQRRMFSPEIVGSDAFFEMPPSTQALYFQLGMRADDDGFVNPKMVMRMIGSSDDELKVLISKRFVLPFNNGVVVIKHWRINNLVRKDWYRPTIYTDEKQQLFLKENGAYTFDEKKGLPLLEEVRERVGNEPSTQDRIGKDRLGKVKEDRIPFNDFWKIYPKKTGKKKAEELWKKLSFEDQQKALADIPLRMHDDKWVNGFHKDPERYIKSEQWNDEIIRPRQAREAEAQKSHDIF